MRRLGDPGAVVGGQCPAPGQHHSRWLSVGSGPERFRPGRYQRDPVRRQLHADARYQGRQGRRRRVASARPAQLLLLERIREHRSPRDDDALRPRRVRGRALHAGPVRQAAHLPGQRQEGRQRHRLHGPRRAQAEREVVRRPAPDHERLQVHLAARSGQGRRRRRDPRLGEHRQDRRRVRRPVGRLPLSEALRRLDRDHRWQPAAARALHEGSPGQG